MLPGDRLTDEYVASFAQLAIAGIEREYPNKPSQVMTSPASVQTPRAMHPAFYGCFDWHSSVHSHWMLVRLAKRVPQAPVASEAHQLLDRQLTAEGLAIEAAYFEQPENHSFERMYGWAWALRLAAELATWDNADATKWADHLRPLERQLVTLTKAYLPRLTYPIRTGTHADTTFALSQTLDYARACCDTKLEKLVTDFGREKFLADRDYPVCFEPSGEDFFSPTWNEADLMRRLLPADEFADWLSHFLPGIGQRNAQVLAMQPATVSDVADPRICHLVGLNLSRAWTQQGVLVALPPADPRREPLQKSVAAHASAGLGQVFSGHYEGEHWLATFAVYLLTESGID